MKKKHEFILLTLYHVLSKCTYWCLDDDISGRLLGMLLLTTILSLDLFSSTTCGYPKTSVKITWSSWTVPCPLELPPWWPSAFCWSVSPERSQMNSVCPLSFYRCGLHSSLGPWRPGGQDPAGVPADGRDGRPLSGLRVPAGENHHHGCGQEGQWSLSHHTWHRWVVQPRQRAYSPLSLFVFFYRFWLVFRVSIVSGNFGDRYFGTDAPPDWSDEEMDEPSYWWHFCFSLFFFFNRVHWLIWAIQGFVPRKTMLWQRALSKGQTKCSEARKTKHTW